MAPVRASRRRDGTIFWAILVKHRFEKPVHGGSGGFASTVFGCVRSVALSGIPHRDTCVIEDGLTVGQYWKQHIVALACPSLAVFGVSAITVGQLFRLDVIERIGETLFGFSILLMLPRGQRIGHRHRPHIG
jgi:hypothetical protein